MNKNDNKEKKQNKEQQNEKDKLLAEYKEHLQRLQAEFDNYRKRIEKENSEFCKVASHELILKILTIVDSFELALKHTEKKEDFVKGIELIYSQLYSLLEKEGLKKIDALNRKFDANYHEVLLTEVDETKDEDTVIEELQKGYMINSKVLRYTKVKISKRLDVGK